MSGTTRLGVCGDSNQNRNKINGDNNMLNVLDEALDCSVCMQFPVRPMTAGFTSLLLLFPSNFV